MATAETIYGVSTNGHALMTVKEVCAALRQSSQYIYDRIQEGALHALRKPGSERSCFRVVRASVIAFMARTAGGIDEREYLAALLFLFRRLPSDLRAAALRKMQEVTPR